MSGRGLVWVGFGPKSKPNQAVGAVWFNQTELKKQKKTKPSVWFGRFIGFVFKNAQPLLCTMKVGLELAIQS